MTNYEALKMASYAMLKVSSDKSDPALTYQVVLEAIEVLRTALAKPEPSKQHTE